VVLEKLEGILRVGVRVAVLKYVHCRVILNRQPVY
jgi:hypothetical protein